MTTIRTQLSDAELKRLSLDFTISEIRDTRHPLAVRFRANRSASVFVVRYQNGKTIRNKISSWPERKIRDVIRDLPHKLNELENKNAISSDWTSVGQVLNWYRERARADRSLTADRRANIESSIKNHLLPKLKHIELRSISRQLIDEIFIWPLQNTLSVATVRFHFAVLKRCFRMASVLNKISIDPIGGMKFSEFIKKPLRPKPSALRPGHLPEVLESIGNANCHMSAFFLLFMLMHGTRIGETRQVRWSFIDWSDSRLTIPGTLTKNGQEHRIPLTEFSLEQLTQYKLNCKSKVFLFPGMRGPIARTPAGRMVKQVSKGEFTAHDLRKLARSWWADLGIDYMVSEQLLNHTPSRLDKTYIHTYLEEQKREALVRWHNKINEFMTDTMPTRSVA